MKTILQVEDEEADIFLLQVVFKKAGIATKLEVATDGDEAIAALQNGKFAAGPPVCVLLDIKLPGRSGLEVLEWIRSQPKFRRLPVILLTSSNQPADINRAYDLGANSYLVKPDDLNALTELIKTVDLYWIQMNTRPV